MEDEIEIFDFLYWYDDKSSHVLGTGTLQLIETLKCTPIEGSGRKVPASFVTVSGVYKPTFRDE